MIRIRLLRNGIFCQIGSKSYIGCKSCVRNRVLGEAGLSMLK